MGRRLTRRQLLRHAGLVAITFPTAASARPGWLSEHAAPASSSLLAIPMHCEVVTVTDTEAVITWFTGDPSAPDEYGRPAPVEAPGRLLLGADPDPTTWEELASHEPTAYHHVRVSGLQPGTRYFFRAESGGVPALPTAFSPLEPDPTNGGSFTTLTPPPGREVMRVAWLNDVHIGEHVSGLAYSNRSMPGGGFPPGFAVDPENPYWRFMARGAVDTALAHGCTLLLANGDLTSSAQHSGLVEANDHFSRFGALGGFDDPEHGRRRLPDGTPWVRPDDPRAFFVTRGNHDRARPGDGHCPPVPDRPDLRDCFRAVFADGFEPGSTRFAVVAGDDATRYRFVGLDSSNIATGEGQLPADELDFLEAELEHGDATIPLFHHHVGDEATLLAMPPGIFGVNQPDAARFRELLSGYDNVVGVYSGHTHRNRRTTSRETGAVPYFEGAATKEYPGGCTVVRLYEGGYMVNFWKTATPDALAWSERSGAST
jgi:3',5'-cyclic-AMP phosphodiesterase